MKVKIFDFEHEKDLEDSINDFLKENHNIKDVKYNISCSVSGEEQIYCYSACIIYDDLHHV